jgi:hypothetical protein
MNRYEKSFGLTKEARLRYDDGEYHVVIPGDFVRCAVTGKRIPLSELRYWSVEQQEAYASAAISFRRYLELRGHPRASESPDPYADDD